MYRFFISFNISIEKLRIKDSAVSSEMLTSFLPLCFSSVVGYECG